MRSITPLALCILAALSACSRPAQPAPGPHADGRYLGIGIYSPGELWSKLAGAKPPAEADRAKLADDEQIIVVVDSRTGEVRQCGNISGVCVSMKPWGQSIGADLTAPVQLTTPSGRSDPAKAAPGTTAP